MGQLPYLKELVSVDVGARPRPIPANHRAYTYTCRRHIAGNGKPRLQIYALESWLDMLDETDKFD